MAHIVDFSIEGLVGRKAPYEKRLNRDVNVFFGRNGSGKTTLLKLLAASVANDTRPILSLPFAKASVVVHSFDLNMAFRRSCERPKPAETLSTLSSTFSSLSSDYSAYLATIDDSEQRWSWKSQPAYPGDRSGRLRHSYLPTSRLYTELLEKRQVSPGSKEGVERALDEAFAGTLKGLWTTYSADLVRQQQAAQATGLANILRSVVSSESPEPIISDLQLDVVHRRVKAFLERQGSASSFLGSEASFAERWTSDSRFRSVAVDINRVEEKIEIALQARTRLQALAAKMFSGDMSVSFEDGGIKIEKQGAGAIGLEVLSSGEKHLLRILVEALSIGPSPLIIDEPEISMHVEWQRELVAALRELNPGSQLIIATHSPEIMADLPESAIFNL